MKENITPELAEIAGIHAGDGYLRYIGKTGELDISGDFEEKDYYDNYVIPLFNRTFKLSITGRYFYSRNTYGFKTTNSSVIETLKNLGFPSGKKSLTVRIPNEIIDSDDPKILTAFLRGYFDTDGCFNFKNRKSLTTYGKFKRTYHYYPRILLTSVSKELIEQLKIILQRLGFNYKVKIDNPKKRNWNTCYIIVLLGRRNMIRWAEIIGSKNPTKLTRYLIWEEFGFNPPHTTYNQRINILAGKISPFELYGPVV